MTDKERENKIRAIIHRTGFAFIRVEIDSKGQTYSLWRKGNLILHSSKFSGLLLIDLEHDKTKAYIQNGSLEEIEKALNV
jgi:hypothetical protein